ncbi:glycerophosphodiester phosphodiesterase family protein [Lysobacter sp. TAF61]|uniref:glycerophosphodiester phosphodiesterase family protein n=1 Tax=Lysobacter sp. TAF61 TaxID=3233072 RepID=UPI003F9BB7F9
MRTALRLCALIGSMQCVAAVAQPPVAHHSARFVPPLIVAHRGGAADYPENTLVAVRGSLANGADAIWLSVQLSGDGVPVLYRPQDLSALTNSRGPVNAWTWRELQRVNAGWNFRVEGADGAIRYPYRSRSVPVPTLESALARIPRSVPVVLDMKSLPPEPLVAAVAHVLQRRNEWSRVLLYSTDASFDPLWARYPRAQRFETRDDTRGRLVTQLLSGRCEPPKVARWSAFELRRRLEVTEKFTLGEGHSQVDAELWTDATMACFRQGHGSARLLWIGINTRSDFQHAQTLGADAVLVDSPAQARDWIFLHKPREGVPGR